MRQATCAAVDAAVCNAVWRWAKRRHPTTSVGGVRAHSCRTQGHRRWVCTGEVTTGPGRTRPIRLFSAVRVPIVRHVEVRAEANPDDPAWECSCEERLGVTMRQALARDRRYGVLWNEQDGDCPVCHQPSTPQTGWHRHHLVWRVQGGSDRADNQVLLHPNCHRQVHSQGLTVVQPRPARGDREARAG